MGDPFFCVAFSVQSFNFKILYSTSRFCSLFLCASERRHGNLKLNRTDYFASYVYLKQGEGLMVDTILIPTLTYMLLTRVVVAP